MVPRLGAIALTTLIAQAALLYAGSLPLVCLPAAAALAAIAPLAAGLLWVRSVSRALTVGLTIGALEAGLLAVGRLAAQPVASLAELAGAGALVTTQGVALVLLGAGLGKLFGLRGQGGAPAAPVSWYARLALAAWLLGTAPAAGLAVALRAATGALAVFTVLTLAFVLWREGSTARAPHAAMPWALGAGALSVLALLLAGPTLQPQSSGPEAARVVWGVALAIVGSAQLVLLAMLSAAVAGRDPVGRALPGARSWWLSSVLVVQLALGAAQRASISWLLPHILVALALVVPLVLRVGLQAWLSAEQAAAERAAGRTLVLLALLQVALGAAAFATPRTLGLGALTGELDDALRVAHGWVGAWLLLVSARWLPPRASWLDRRALHPPDALLSSAVVPQQSPSVSSSGHLIRPGSPLRRPL